MQHKEKAQLKSEWDAMRVTHGAHLGWPRWPPRSDLARAALTAELDAGSRKSRAYVVPIEFDPAEFGGTSAAAPASQLQAEGVPARPPYPFPLPRAAVFARDPRNKDLVFPEAERVAAAFERVRKNAPSGG